MKHIGLFEGIGGFSLAARWAGWETVAWCEWNEFGQKVLRHHFPKAKGHGDITKTDFTIYRGQCDIITGGFPCQPYSQAGKRLGKEDERHLWPEMLRAIREVQPRWVVGENVLGLVNWSGGLVFHEVQTDLEAAGYEVFPYVLPACAVNAPHRRDRVWFIAHSKNKRGETREREILNRSEWENEKHKPLNGDTVRNRIEPNGISWDATNPDSNGQFGCDSEHEKHTSKGGLDALNDINEVTMRTNGFDNFKNFPTQPPICGGDDGLPSELDGITFPKWRSESIKAYGNAIVPQLAFQIFQAINEFIQTDTI
jgi:DNA (cytosine-5)-methyltransferase 1